MTDARHGVVHEMCASCFDSDLSWCEHLNGPKKEVKMCSCTEKHPSCHCSRDKKEIDVDWPHGHVTSTGLDAKYIGQWVYNPEFYVWLLSDGKCVSFNKYGTKALGSMSLKEKPALSKWINLYEDGDGEIFTGYGRYTTKQAGIQAWESYKRVTNNTGKYLTTIEIARG